MESVKTDLVQSLADQGIGAVLEGQEPDGLHLFQYYGSAHLCDLHEISIIAGVCSEDGILWRSSDHGSPYLCTAHMFQPGNGLELHEMAVAK